MDKKEMLIAGGVVAGLAVLVLLTRGSGNGSSATGSGGTTDIMGGFSTAGTVYVPTSSYDLQYNTYKGAVTYTTTNNTTTETYGSPVALPLQPVDGTPIIKTGSGSVVNPVTQPVTMQTAPKAPSHPTGTATKTNTPTSAKMGTMHYATPKGGYNPNSVVDYIKQHGGYADMASRTKLAGEVGIKGYTGTAAQNKTLLGKLKAKYGA